MIKRFFSELERFLEPNKALIIYGPRRVGKTTLIRQFLERTKLKYRSDSGDDLRVREILGSSNFTAIKNYVGDNELVVIDEAQNISGIGMGLKIIVDNIPGIKLIATGSSSFDLANQVGEPLVGRTRTLTLFPVAEMELTGNQEDVDFESNIESRLIYGNYPEIISAVGDERKCWLLEEIANGYLLKDVLALDGIKKSQTLVDLVKLLALQLGNEVSVRELATQLSVNVKTVERYLDLLEKTFVIIPLHTLHRNLRNEIRGKRKYYFYDTGVRNAFISQLSPLDRRQDVGALWENYLFIERLKKCSYQQIYSNRYFWRTYNQKEIDLVEEREGKLFAYEFKWGGKEVKAPKDFLFSYPNGEYKVINKENYLDFII